MPMSTRIRICFDCKVYIPLFPDNPEAIKDEKWFNTIHNLHMVQTISITELDGRADFTCVSRTARKKALKELEKGLKQ